MSYQFQATETFWKEFYAQEGPRRGCDTGWRRPPRSLCNAVARQLLAEGFERADLVGDAVNARNAVLVFFLNGLLPKSPNDAVDGYVFLRRKGPYFAVNILLQQFQSTDYRAVLLIVRAKFQRGQQGWQYPAKVGTIRVANHRAELLPIYRSGCLPFSNQIAQGLLIDHGKDDFSHNAVGMLQSGFR